MCGILLILMSDRSGKVLFFRIFREVSRKFPKFKFDIMSRYAEHYGASV